MAKARSSSSTQANQQLAAFCLQAGCQVVLYRILHRAWKHELVAISSKAAELLSGAPKTAQLHYQACQM